MFGKIPPAPHSDRDEPAHEHLGAARSGSVRLRIVTILVLSGALVSLLVAVPGLKHVTSEITHLNMRWIVVAAVMEFASCASFVVIFRQFFSTIAGPPARELAWTEMGSGALLPGGGVGSLAVGGWLLHLAGMPTQQIVRKSSGLFFLTSSLNVLALVLGGILLASGLSGGKDDIALAGAPIIVGSSVALLAATISRVNKRRLGSVERLTWLSALLRGIDEAEHALRHPSWRLSGGIGYLGFDMAALWATLTAVGYEPPIAVLILGYLIGYLANLIPIPGGIGVLEVGLAGTLVLYGAPFASATAGVLIYRAIAFWIPSLGGLLAYRLLRGQLSRPGDFGGGATLHAPDARPDLVAAEAQPAPEFGRP